MGTRFLMSADSPVPRATLERYLAVGDPARIRVSDALDGLPQRMIDNPCLSTLERFGPLRRALYALRTAQAWRRQSGLGAGQMLGLALKALREHDYTVSQTLMAANAPFLIRRAIVEGVPDEGVLPSGQAAAMIGALESCDALIARIVADAAARLDALAVLRGSAATQDT
jgi:nitronate monooxygenase